MNICIFDIEPWEKKFFHDLGKENEVCLIENSLDTEQAKKHNHAEVLSIFVYSQITREILDQLPDLKFIATRSTGINHIDAQECKKRNIEIAVVPSYGKHTVAEHAFGLLLTLSHRLEEAVSRTRKGDFSPRGLEGFDLKGKTIGVIGTGDIGLGAIKIARGFGMEVLAFDVVQNHQASSDLKFKYVSMDELLSGSDVITIHVPLTPKTENLLSEESFAKMKEGAVLINTSRGKVVHTQSLVKALTEEKLAGAGLDVLPEEPVIREETEVLRAVYEEKHNVSTLLADQMLTRMNNVVITPHSAFNTKEAVHRILSTTFGNIEKFTQGKKTENLVEQEA